MAKVNACGKILKNTSWIFVTALSLSGMMIGTVLLSTNEHAPHGKTCPAKPFINSVADELRRLVRIDDEEVLSSNTRLADEVRQFEVHELKESVTKSIEESVWSRGAPPRAEWCQQISVANHQHKGGIYNGIYTRGALWSGKPHYTSPTGKHLFFWVNYQDPSDFAWQMDDEDQSNFPNPGLKNVWKGGYAPVFHHFPLGDKLKWDYQDGSTSEISITCLDSQVGAQTPPGVKKEPFEWAKTQKVRKDWNDLTDDERKLYFKAVNAMKTKTMKTPGGDSNLYDIFVIIHGEGNNKAYAHQTSGFLAWHRKYLLEFETAFRSLSEEFKWVTLPYWDWSAEMFECKKQGVFLDAEPCLTYHGASKLLRDFGGPGTAGTTGTVGSSNSDGKNTGPVGCLTTGPFKGWKDHNGKCLSRGVNWKIHAQTPFTGRVRLAEIISQYPKFGGQRERGFRRVIEGTPHGMTHMYLGGHLGTFISPADPIFFSHHAYVDKIWATWQDCHEHDTVAVKKLLESGVGDYSTYYSETSHNKVADKVSDPLRFNFPLGVTSSPVGQCAKSDATCALCVHKQDPWCANAAWDHICNALCTDPKCAKSCKEPEPQLLDMHKKGKTVLPNWDLSEVTPASMQSTLLLQGDRSYTYSPDEFERYLEQKVPELLGKCKLDSHKRAQEKAGSLLETQRLHHSCKPRGEAALDHASMVKKAFNSASDLETDKVNKAHSKTHSKSSLDMKPAFKNAEKAECNEMAAHKDGTKGDFQKEFNCKAVQPRFFLPWLGSEQWHELMNDSAAKHDVFQDPCCAGDEQALAPAAVR